MMNEEKAEFMKRNPDYKYAQWIYWDWALEWTFHFVASVMEECTLPVTRADLNMGEEYFYRFIGGQASLRSNSPLILIKTSVVHYQKNIMNSQPWRRKQVLELMGSGQA